MDTNKLENLILKHGGHKSADEGLCLLEAVAYVAGEPHSDRPACTDPVLGAFGRAVNDFMTGDERQLLVPIVHKLVGTACDHTVSLRRAMMICDGVVRQILPLAFDGIAPDVAEMLRDLQPVTDEATASAARSAAESAAESARSAAWSAAESAESAAWSAWSAARSAAWSAESAESAESAAWSARSAWSAAESAAESARKAIIDALVQIFNAALEIK